MAMQELQTCSSGLVVIPENFLDLQTLHTHGIEMSPGRLGPGGLGFGHCVAQNLNQIPFPSTTAASFRGLGKLTIAREPRGVLSDTSIWKGGSGYMR